MSTDDYDETVTRDNDDSERIASNLSRKCAIYESAEPLFSDLEAAIRHFEFAVVTTMEARSLDQGQKCLERRDEAKSRIFDVVKEIQKQAYAEVAEMINHGLPGHARDET